MPERETIRLAELATELTLSDFPEAAQRAAVWGMLDAVGCAVAGAGERAAVVARDWVRVDRPSGPSTVLCAGASSSASGAALANGTAAHALDFDDVCWAMNAHPSAVLAPTAIAAGEATGASGRDVLLAYSVGFEVAGRLGEALGGGHYAAGWHPTATLGVFGATATAGVLLRLDAETLARAFGIASSLAAGTRLNFGTDTKPLHAGFAAASGITAAELAARGATARSDALEAAMGFAELHGGRPPLVRTDRDRFCLLEPGIEHKPYPACRFTHRIIEATVRLRARHPDATPSRVECHMDAFAREILIYPAARSALEAKFSAPYCVALAWLQGAPEIATFTDERVLRDDTRALAARVQVVDGGKATESVTVFFGDGSEDRESIALPLGHPARPLAREAHAAKVLSCLRTRLGDAPAARVMASLEDVAAVPDIRAVTHDLR